jgi:hypothetical protein
MRKQREPAIAWEEIICRMVETAPLRAMIGRQNWLLHQSKTRTINLATATAEPHGTRSVDRKL